LLRACGSARDLRYKPSAHLPERRNRNRVRDRTPLAAWRPPGHIPAEAGPPRQSTEDRSAQPRSDIPRPGGTVEQTFRALLRAGTHLIQGRFRPAGIEWDVTGVDGALLNELETYAIGQNRADRGNAHCITARRKVDRPGPRSRRSTSTNIASTSIAHSEEAMRHSYDNEERCRGRRRRTRVAVTVSASRSHDRPRQWVFDGESFPCSLRHGCHKMVRTAREVRSAGGHNVKTGTAGYCRSSRLENSLLCWPLVSRGRGIRKRLTSMRDLIERVTIQKRTALFSRPRACATHRTIARSCQQPLVIKAINLARLVARHHVRVEPHHVDR